VLPLTVMRNPARLGYARTVEGLLRLAAERTDRPKRDTAIVMHADFRHGAQYLPEFVRRIDGGADLVVGQGVLRGEASRAHRLLRRVGPLLLRDRVRVAGVHDVVSGFLAVRIATLRAALRDGGPSWLRQEGWAANAELIAQLGRRARRVDAVDTVERHDLRPRASRLEPWPAARALWRARRSLAQAAPVAAPAPEEPAAELVS
jgi:hypothetical protein